MSIIARNGGNAPRPLQAERFRTVGERIAFTFACADRAHVGWLLQSAARGGDADPGPGVVPANGEKAS